MIPAFALAGYASFWLVVARCVLTALAGINYRVICRHYRDGENAPPRNPLRGGGRESLKIDKGAGKEFDKAPDLNTESRAGDISRDSV